VFKEQEESMRRTLFLGVMLAAGLTHLSAAGSGELSPAVLQEQFQYDDIREIVVGSRYFGVDIAGEDRSGVAGEIFATEEDRVVHRNQGGRLLVEVQPRRNISFQMGTSPRLVLRIPREAAVRVESGSGSVRVVAVSHSQGVVVESGSGAVAVADIDGPTDVDTGSGSVDVRNVRGRVTISTASGSIQAAGIDGDLRTDTASGSQRLVRIDGDVEATSASGGVQLNETEGRVRVETASGSQQGEELVLTGDSSFRSSSGSIRMDFVNPLDELRIDATAGSGTIRVGSNRGDRLVVGDGPIVVTGKTSSGGQEYR
jgi:DUF4097 and DUF4098 domain-containing protein YvlB